MGRPPSRLPLVPLLPPLWEGEVVIVESGNVEGWVVYLGLLCYLIVVVIGS